MTRRSSMVSVPWVGPGDPFPPTELALGEETGYGGLLAVGADLAAERLLDAYAHGIFPWYSTGQPILWWSPDPRMVLYVDEFRVSRSLRRTLRRVSDDPEWSLRFDTSFDDVMLACAGVGRREQSGTWITDEICAAYGQLHRLGHAHSFEAWHRGRLVGGGYGVSIGSMFYGESMFSIETDASKIALAGLVNCLRSRNFRVIDCQQNTRHLASLGAREIGRDEFVAEVSGLVQRAACNDWPSRLSVA